MCEVAEIFQIGVGCPSEVGIPRLRHTVIAERQPDISIGIHSHEIDGVLSVTSKDLQI